MAPPATPNILAVRAKNARFAEIAREYIAERGSCQTERRHQIFTLDRRNGLIFEWKYSSEGRALCWRGIVSTYRLKDLVLPLPFATSPSFSIIQARAKDDTPNCRSLA